MATRLRVGIAGAGVLGRLLAWRLSRAGHAVTVFDPAPGPQPPATGTLVGSAQPHAAGFTAAGMLSPLAELECASPAIARLGWRSLGLWRAVNEALMASGAASSPLFFQRGSLMLAHAGDSGAAQRVLARLQAAPVLCAELPTPQALDTHSLQALEPALSPQLRGWLLPDEGQLLPRALLAALCAGAPDVWWNWGETVAAVSPGAIQLAGEGTVRFDWAIDVRGVAAGRPVRGVRGELVWLHAPGVGLQRPLRLLHPRHRVYIVPRPGDLFVVGASEIESEDRSPVSLKSAVELMAAAHSVLPGLAEARIVHLETNLRPALPDHEPQTQVEPGLLRINGLFRHGWLLAPALVEDALERCGLGDSIQTEALHHA
jgi:glycine oxidase